MSSLSVFQKSTARVKNFLNRFCPHMDDKTRKWFSGVFITFILSFLVVLLPLAVYLNRTFVDLETERAKKQLDSGISQLDGVVENQLYVMQTLNSDSRFLPLYYTNPDYDAIDVNTRSQMRSLFSTMMSTQKLVRDAAMVFGNEIIITTTQIFYHSATRYYPDFFECTGMSFAEWEAMLRAHPNRFLSCRITTNHVLKENGAYDAIVYCTPGRSGQLTYSCIDVGRLKKTMIATESLGEYALTVATADGVIYSDRPEAFRSHHKITQTTSLGGLTVTLEMSDRLFSQKMAPFYTFISVYSAVAIAVLVLLMVAGTRISAHPVLKILRVLEKSRNLPPPAPTNNETRIEKAFWTDFNRIAGSIAAADSSIGQYRQITDRQQSILQARFFEKGVAGTLVTQADRDGFDTYFPAFPAEYHLALLHIRAQPSTEGEPIELPQTMALLQAFAQSRLPDCYAQQFSAHELILLIPRDQFAVCRGVLDFVIDNVNAQEPSLAVEGYAGDLYTARDDLPRAYRQLQDMALCFFENSRTRLCTPEERSARDVGAPFVMADLQTMYTAIGSGNNAMAQLKLRACSDSLAQTQNAAWMHSGCALFRSVLNYIRLEHAPLLMDIPLPEPTERPLFELFSPVVEAFCAAIGATLPEKKNELAAEILEYIDNHFTNDQLSLTWLEGALKYSTSTMQKAVKSATGMTIAAYIEKKRMAYANELIAEKKRTIADIAAACGFGSVNSFYKAYKRVFGHAPTDGQS